MRPEPKEKTCEYDSHPNIFWQIEDVYTHNLVDTFSNNIVFCRLYRMVEMATYNVSIILSLFMAIDRYALVSLMVHFTDNVCSMLYDSGYIFLLLYFMAFCDRLALMKTMPRCQLIENNDIILALWICLDWHPFLWASTMDIKGLVECWGSHSNNQSSLSCSTCDKAIMWYSTLVWGLMNATGPLVPIWNSKCMHHWPPFELKWQLYAMASVNQTSESIWVESKYSVSCNLLIAVSTGSL